MILAIGTGKPRDLVGQWLKVAPGSDTLHQVIWKNGDELVAGCHARMSAKQATSARLGARICEVCRCNALAKEEYARKRTR